MPARVPKDTIGNKNRKSFIAKKVLYLIKKIYILFLLSAFWAGHTVFAQTVNVCRGDKVMYKADGLPKSIYQYDLKDGGTFIAGKQYNDSVGVQWGNKLGVFKLGVLETSAAGCPGEWAWLDVPVVGTDIKFGKAKYNLCEGDSVFIDFNTSDFQGWSWSDASVNSNNYIHKAGTYELRAVDNYGCRTTTHLSILANHTPIAKLGKDTMMCSPDFTLYLLQASKNSPRTVYTWSTGASGETPELEVKDHDVNKDVLYWVRADFDGCSASDTIVVMACDAGIELDIPNTITPNNDGENDVWRISALQPYPDVTVEIFDRWGRKVFTSAKGYPTPWDGRDTKGHYLPMETYYYIIHLNDGKHKKPLLGTITIIR